MQRIAEIAAAKPQSIILREKDMSEDAYTELARSVTDICSAAAVPCTLHSFVQSAVLLGAERIHLPLFVLRQMPNEQKRRFAVIGVSVHTAEEAEEAEARGADYLTAGHIFATDCKKGLPGRGLDFLSDVCRRVRIPVYAIGGIAPENIAAVRNAGASGACIMSSLMQCEAVQAYLNQLRGQL